MAQVFVKNWKTEITEADDKGEERTRIERASKHVDVEIVKENVKTVWVRLPGGKVIKKRREEICEKAAE
jgi:hypothetical protein